MRVLKVPTPRPASCSIREESTGRLWTSEFRYRMPKHLDLPEGEPHWRRSWAVISWVRSGLYTLRVTVMPAASHVHRLEGEWEAGEFSHTVELWEGKEAEAFSSPNRSVRFSWNGESLTAELRG